MKAILKTYTNSTLAQSEIVEIPDNYDGDPYGDTIPFCIGSNQSLEVLDAVSTNKNQSTQPHL
jgi:hypothetical protein|tara:strand:+ start:148 stop:336 length:189 start_codon:yes stop_codon:yes gene_type:complete